MLTQVLHCHVYMIHSRWSHPHKVGSIHYRSSVEYLISTLVHQQTTTVVYLGVHAWEDHAVCIMCWHTDFWIHWVNKHSWAPLRSSAMNIVTLSTFRMHINLCGHVISGGQYSRWVEYEYWRGMHLVIPFIWWVSVNTFGTNSLEVHIMQLKEGKGIKLCVLNNIACIYLNCRLCTYRYLWETQITWHDKSWMYTNGLPTDSVIRRPMHGWFICSW